MFFLFGDEFSTAAVDTVFRRVSNGYVWLDKMFCFVSSLESVTAVSSCQLLDETACVLE